MCAQIIAHKGGNPCDVESLTISDFSGKTMEDLQEQVQSLTIELESKTMA